MYLFLDTETGGLDPKETDLLSVGCIKVREDFTRIDRLSINVAPDSGIYRVNPQALQINGIDLAHRLDVHPYNNASSVLWEWLDSLEFSSLEKYTIAGWNVNFDIGFLKAQLFANQDAVWNSLFQFQVYDVQSVVQYATSVGILAKNLQGRGMHTVAQALGFPIDKHEPHDVLRDTEATLFIANTVYQQAAFFKNRKEG